MNSLQFELWRECNNLCKMCFLGIENRITPKEIKIQSLKDAIRDSIKFEGDVIAAIGGEFFQGQIEDLEVHDLFYEFIQLIINKLNTEEIKSVWITATLTDKTPKDLIEFVSFIKNSWNGKGTFFICTSYDTIGRFHTEEKRLNWEQNMFLIKNMDSRIRLNTSMILTNDLINKYLNDEIAFIDFTAKYDTGLMIKHPNAGPFGDDLKKMEAALPGFVPELKNTIRFFKKLKLKEPFIFHTCLFNVNKRADECVKRYNSGKTYHDHRDKIGINEYIDYDQVLPCGHSTLYRCYKDSDRCMMCDYLKIRDS